jgi:hypothetical protein
VENPILGPENLPILPERINPGGNGKLGKMATGNQRLRSTCRALPDAFAATLHTPFHNTTQTTIND